jgi:hypothetical protein
LTHIPETIKTNDLYYNQLLVTSIAMVHGIKKSKNKMRHTKVKDLLNSTTLHEVNAKVG